MHKTQPQIVLLLGIAGVLLSLFRGCEKEVPLSVFDFDYQPQYKIEAVFYPANLSKSVMRVERTFTIKDTMSIERAYVNDAAALLRVQGGRVLCTLSWQDSAAAYSYYATTPGGPNQPGFPFGQEDAEIDTLVYGAYKLDDPDFTLSDSLTYELQVVIDGEAYTTTFQPYPAVHFTNIQPDMVSLVRPENGGPPYEVQYVTMRADTARLAWPEDPNAYFYSVYIEPLQAPVDMVPQVFAFPGPEFSLSSQPGEYLVIIGAMNATFYNHYYLNDFPANHEARNFFDGKALGFAGTLNEQYLRIRILPAGTP